MFSQKEIEEWKRPRNFNKALGEAQHLIEYADMNKVNFIYMKSMVLNDRTRKQGFFTTKTVIENSKSSAKGFNLKVKFCCSFYVRCLVA